MRGQFNAETCFKQFHVAQILLLRHITVRVAKNLHFRRKAPNIETQDLATTRKTGSREYPTLAVAHAVHAVTCFVKDECVNVNLEPVAVGEYKVRFCTTFLKPEPSIIHNLSQPRQVGDLHNDV